MDSHAGRAHSCKPKDRPTDTEVGSDESGHHSSWGTRRRQQWQWRRFGDPIAKQPRVGSKRAERNSEDGAEHRPGTVRVSRRLADTFPELADEWDVGARRINPSPAYCPCRSTAAA